MTRFQSPSSFIYGRINTGKVCSCDELRKLIKKQLSNDDIIEWEEFDVGYINGKRGEKVISIRSREDLAEVWKEVKSEGDKMQLWCDGLKIGQREEQSRKKNEKGLNSDDDDSEDDHPRTKSAREQREEKLKQAVDTLNKSMDLTTPQCNIKFGRTEVYANGMHRLG